MTKADTAPSTSSSHEGANKHAKVNLVQASKKGRPLPPPREPPPFTVADIRAAIPAHCFNRSAFWSFMYLFRDLALISMMGFAAYNILDSGMLPSLLTAALWPVYWYIQGAFMTGVWVVAHECGHQAFSSSKTLNNAVGTVCHSALLVPYHSWRISHANHHKNTNSQENDEVFVLPTRHDFGGVKEVLEETPIASILNIVGMLVFGWPAYLVANVAGPAKYRGKPNSHFNPKSALYRPAQRSDIVQSDFFFFVAVAAIFYCTYLFGVRNVVFYYFIPYLVVNYHLVLITYLQHTASYVPRYRQEEFTWLRGALSTVDRSMGSFLDRCFHHIADTHVAHHLFHTMPFYHAEEATEAIKKVIGPYYLRDETPTAAALYSSWRECRLVEDYGSYLYPKSK